MWILPKQLHTSAYVPDMEALNLDLNESSQLCAASLFVRSKPLPLRTWLQKWKRDSWTQHLSGRILKPSHGTAFETAWTSSLAVTRASHLAVPASEPEQMTQDTSGHLLQIAFKWYDPNCVSSRTWRDTSRWDSPASSAIWKRWVTKCRGQYSARLNAARRTSESECLSWPTVTANEDSYRIGGNSQQSKCLSAMARRGEMSGQPAQGNNSTHGSRPESWATPRTMTGGTCKNGVQHCDLNSQAGGKLNARWVETLMNLPVGWTMPSCASPVTIAQTSCASSETE